MTEAEAKAITQLRTTPRFLELSASNIDAENGIIRDVVMAEEGEAKGHGINIDAQFIADLVAYDQANYAKSGVRVRFDHPSGGAMGSQLARMKNVRKRKSDDGKMQAIADLHLLQAAKQSPTHGDMYSWVLAMAKEDPEFIMSSIVFSPGEYFQKKGNGQKKRIWHYDENDNWVSYDSKLGVVFVTLGEHYFTDLVDDGAATTSMFKTPAAEQPAKKLNPMTLLEILFGKKAATEAVELSPEQISELRQKLSDAETTLSTLQDNFDKATEDLKVANDALATKTTELNAALDKIKVLEAKPADKHTDGDREDKGDAEVKKYKSDPMTAKALAAYNAGKK